MMDIVVFQPYSLKNTENAGELAQVLSNMGTIGVEKNLPTAQGDMRGHIHLHSELACRAPQYYGDVPI